ncbi:hypothetical protein [Longimicrobium sp.]|uniref:hypothetical protein n=1 Tax=Longimicrobium sp. TaxID=2029185 RepID=UPI002E333A21|nr:hypothetical protein [Longimicrobium sp.]HEX6038883.1 hypothetical protein [Longimicrobium sp.]
MSPALECGWCLEKRRCIETPIFSGYCGYDVICGTCGSEWNTDDGRFRKIDNDERDANIARVAAMPDPKCWECHDTGDTGEPMDEPGTHPCKCGAGR